MSKKIIIGLSLTIVFQAIILVGMYISAALPLWTGVEVKIKTTPVDPRSMFRGNYARLSYEISRIESKHFNDSEGLRDDEIIYVILEQGENELYELSSVSLSKPKNGIFLRGRVDNGRWRSESEPVSVKYGIDAFFAKKEKALVLEDELRDGGIAVLMVSSSGKARLKDVIAE